MIESFITHDHSKIISLAKDFIYGDLLDFKLFIQKDFNELLCKMDQVRAQKKEDFKDEKIYYKVSKKDNKEKMKGIEQSDNAKNNSLEKIVTKTLKTGRLELGDQIYTLNMVKKIVEFANFNQSRDELPPIFIELEKSMKNLKK